MAILIESVTITPNSLNVGQSFFISARVEESKWNDLKNELQTWGEVRRSFRNWEAVKDFIYTIPTVAPTSECIYCSCGSALFDVDAVQISVPGGATIQNTADVVDWFVGEVKNE